MSRCNHCLKAEEHIDRIEALYRSYRDKAAFIIRQQQTAEIYMTQRIKELESEINSLKKEQA